MLTRPGPAGAVHEAARAKGPPGTAGQDSSSRDNRAGSLESYWGQGGPPRSSPGRVKKCFRFLFCFVLLLLHSLHRQVSETRFMCLVPRWEHSCLIGRGYHWVHMIYTVRNLIAMGLCLLMPNTINE